MEIKSQHPYKIPALFTCGVIAISVLMAITSLPAAAVSGNDFYVNASSGHDGNPGDSGNPTKTIGKAVFLASSFDTIHIAAGTYRESISTNKSLLFQGESVANTILDGCMTVACDNQWSTGFSLYGASQSSIRDMTITNMSGDGINLSDAGTDLSARRIRLTKNYRGVFVNDGSLTLQQAEISGNTDEGIHLNPGATTILLKNITISGNGSNGVGTSAGTGLVNFLYSTIAHNASWGIAAYREIHSANSIFYKNGSASSGGDCSINNSGGPDDMVSDGNNIDGDNSCGFFEASDLNYTNPLLAPLAENDSPLRTHGLEAGSPAVDAGNDATCEDVDQRGVVRPVGDHCDIGAHEGTVDSGMLMPITLPSGKTAVVPM